MLREISGLPLLGVVAINVSDVDRRKLRRSLLKLSAAILSLFFAYGVAIAYFILKSPTVV